LERKKKAKQQEEGNGFDGICNNSSKELSWITGPDLLSRRQLAGPWGIEKERKMVVWSLTWSEH